MIDKWFKEELDKIFNSHQIAVVIDLSGELAFLLEGLNSEYQLFKTADEIEELNVKYRIEKNRESGSKYLIYTQTSKERLSFIREYCETNGNIEINRSENYIKDKVFSNLGINLPLDKEELLSAAKESIGKEDGYWMDLNLKGATNIFNFKKELVPFLNAPKTYLEKYDKEQQKMFCKQLQVRLKQPTINKPASSLAFDTVKIIFDGLSTNSLEGWLEEIYFSWLDSLSSRDSLKRYLASDIQSHGKDSLWDFHPSHPFTGIDEVCLKTIGDELRDKKRRQFYLEKIKPRANSKVAATLDITYWKGIEEILAFDETIISGIDSFSAAVELYTGEFYKLDRAARTLYTHFLNNKALLKPWQEYYRSLLITFLDKWFSYIEQYKQNQTGTLQRIIDENEVKTAIVVGDGITYELAQNIASKVSGKYKIDNSYILADTPSDTENNMSQIYVKSGDVLKIHKRRESYLSNDNAQKSIEFIQLDDINDRTNQAHYLICSCKDIDSISEKMQQKALKYFSEAEDFISKKIEQLLKSGYQKVYLISDHGFVLTGILSESDKISNDFGSEVKLSERYIKSPARLNLDSNQYFERKVEHDDYQYLYFAKNLNPFKTPGVYGYSHGGISPQELITPYICWSNESETARFKVKIVNKKELQSVTGKLFNVLIEANSSDNSESGSHRKVELQLQNKDKLVSKSAIYTIKPGSRLEEEFSFEAYSELQITLLDANSKVELDRVIAKQNSARDLDGLF